jgi:hypothetical protein
LALIPNRVVDLVVRRRSSSRRSPSSLAAHCEVPCVPPGILPRVLVCRLSTRRASSNETKIHARRAHAPNLFLACRDARCPAYLAHPRRLLAGAPTRQLSLSYPRQHATVVVFVEFANTLLPIRLSSLLCASLRARRGLPVVPQCSCLPLAHVNARASVCCHYVALALCPSGFTCARICRRAVEPVLSCSTSSLPF